MAGASSSDSCKGPVRRVELRFREDRACPSVTCGTSVTPTTTSLATTCSKLSQAAGPQLIIQYARSGGLGMGRSYEEVSKIPNAPGSATFSPPEYNLADRGHAFAGASEASRRLLICFLKPLAQYLLSRFPNSSRLCSLFAGEEPHRAAHPNAVSNPAGVCAQHAGTRPLLRQ